MRRRAPHRDEPLATVSQHPFAQQPAQPVVIVGSLALDHVRTPFGEREEALGGAAVYSATAASFFTPVRLVGVVGEDFPTDHLQSLAARGVDLEGVETKHGKTFRWSGYYEYDLHQAHTVSTELNVFADFRPQLPERYRDSPYVFLANIGPDLQLSVLDQMTRLKLAVFDTMNYWITSQREQVLEVIRRCQVILLNDAEARQLGETHSLIAAARQVLALGPRAVVIKKGEHGAVMFTEGSHFSAPSYPLEEVKDPTGAGDTFAGGLIGYLAGTDDLSETSLRKAVVFGTVMASFAVEDFSLDRLQRLTHEEILARYRALKEIAHFEEP